MLKSVLYYLLMVTTAVRLVDVIYILTRESTNLPFSVIAVTSVMILYGIFLVAKKLTGSVLLKQVMSFYIVQAVLVAINIIGVSINVPLRISVAETFIVGSFLDILISFCAVYACMKQMRNEYRPFVRVVGREQV